MATTITPDAASVSGSSAAETEPTLAEAFGELANALAADDAPGTAATQSAPGDTDTLSAPSPFAAPATQAASVAETSAIIPPSPSSDANAASHAVDPLAGTTPLTYTVNGETRTFDGVYVKAGFGAIIDNDALPKIQDRLQQADRLVETNRQLYAQSQEFQQVGGRQGVEDLVAKNAMLNRSASLLFDALQNEETLLALATDPVARQHLLRELQLSGREALDGARGQFRQGFTDAARVATVASQTQTAITGAVSELAKQFPGLTTDDVAAVRAHAGRVQSAIVRPATPDEARVAGVRPGELIIDLPTLHTFLSDRHTLRQQVGTIAAQQATTTKENAARLAAATPTAGKASAPASRPGAGKKLPPHEQKIDTMTSAELTRAMKTGRIYSMMDDE